MPFSEDEDLLMSDDEGYDPENDFEETLQSAPQSLPTASKGIAQASKPQQSNQDLPQPQLSSLPSGPSYKDSNRVPKGPKAAAPLPPQSESFKDLRSDQRSDGAKRYYHNDNKYDNSSHFAGYSTRPNDANYKNPNNQSKQGYSAGNRGNGSYRGDLFNNDRYQRDSFGSNDGHRRDSPNDRRYNRRESNGHASNNTPSKQSTAAANIPAIGSAPRAPSAPKSDGQDSNGNGSEVIKAETENGVKKEEDEGVNVKQEIKEEIKEEIKSEVKEEVKEEIKIEVKDEVKEEIKIEVKEEAIKEEDEESASDYDPVADIEEKLEQDLKNEQEEEEEEEEEEGGLKEKDDDDDDYEIGDIDDYDNETPQFTESEKNESRKILEHQNEVKQKIPKGIHLFLDLENKTEEALGAFTNLEKCYYAKKALGVSKQSDTFSCECVEEFEDGINSACIDEDCINRGTKIECVNDHSSCGGDCANQRFQKKEYANIAIIDAGRKGYGVRSEEDLEPDTFIYEYIGEVINEATFKKRMIEYDQENLRHFYFMMLQKGEFIDATKKGSLGRFCNHSCNPNCYVEKWLVGDKLKMGIFSKRKILRGEELTFNYNVDRYGADAQKCYCGEPNCIGFIGGKTQTDSASLLPHLISEALGSSVEDEQEFIKAKQDEDEPIVKNENNINVEFVKALKMKPLAIHEVNHVLGTLLQCEDELIADKLIERIELSDSQGMNKKLAVIHGFSSLGRLIESFYHEDESASSESDGKESSSEGLRIEESLVLRIVKVLQKWPAVSKTAIDRSGIIPIINDLRNNTSNKLILSITQELLDTWETYEEYVKISKSDKIRASTISFHNRRAQDSASTQNSPAKSVSTGQVNHGYLPSPHNSSPAPRSSHNYGGSYQAPSSQQQQQYKVQYSEADKLEHRERKEKEEREERKREAIKLAEKQALERKKKDNNVLRVIENAKRREEQIKKQEEEARLAEEAKIKKKEEYKKKLAERKRRAKEGVRITTTLPKDSPSVNGPSLNAHEFEKLWKAFFAQYVPNILKGVDKNITRDEIKVRSKEIIKSLIGKERHRDPSRKPPAEITPEKLKKVKEFVRQKHEGHISKKRKIEEVKP